MATPHVTATIALILQTHPGLTFDQVRSILISTAVDRGGVGFDDFYGYGRLDAFAAAASVLGVGDDGPAASGPRLMMAPNPFTSRLRIEYAAGRFGGSVEVFDIHGSRVWEARADAASGTLTWDGRRLSGQALPAGLYLVRYSDGERTAFQRVVLLD